MARNVQYLWAHDDSIICTMTREPSGTYRAELNFESGAYAGRIVVSHDGNVAAWLAHVQKETAYHRRYGYTIAYVWKG